MTNPTLAVIVGSNRRDSINRKLAQGIANLAKGRFDVNSSRSTICRFITRTMRTTHLLR